MDESKEFNSSLRLIARSSVVVFIGLFLAKIFSYVYRLIIARNYGPEAYGLFSLGLVMVSWIGVIAIFGLNDGLLRYIAMLRGKNQQKRINYLFKKSFYLLLATGLLGGILLFVFAPFISNNIFHEPGLTAFLRILSLSLPLSVIMSVFQSVLRAYEKVNLQVFLSTILTNLLQVGFIIFFVFLGIGAISIPLSYTIGVFVVFLASIIAVKRKVPEVFPKSNYKGSRLFHELLSYSWPLIFAEIIWKVFKWTDSFLIGFFRSATEVGFYNAAVPIALLLTFSSDLFMQMFVPLINKEYSKKNMGVVKQLSQQVGKWQFFTNLPVFILLFLFPEKFLEILFGNEYIVAAGSLQLLSIGVIFLSFSGVSTRLIAMAGKSKKLMFNILFMGAINLVLNILLIPRYGINGAAMSTSFSFIFLSLLVIVQAYKETKILPIRRKNLNILFAAIISLGLLLLIKKYIALSAISFVMLAIFFLAAYTMLVLLFKGFDRNDLMIFKSFLGKLKKD